MSQTLTMLINLFAYSDGAKTNNPQLRDFDYARRISDVPTSKTRSQQHIVNVAEQETVLSMLRPLTTGATWTVSNPNGVTARYTRSGVNPVLRTERLGGDWADGDTVSVARLANSRVWRLTFSNVIPAGVQAGDEIFLGEGSGLSLLNLGIFTVVAAAQYSIDVLSDSMVNETAAVISALDMYVYSPGPVRIGDFLRVTNTGFNFGNRGDFQITRVTSRFIEVQNMNLVPEGPITQDVTVYDQLYKLTYIEADQKVNVYVNNATSPITLEPVQDGEPGLVAVYLVRGPVFSVQIENVGLNPANVTTFFAT